MVISARKKKKAGKGAQKCQRMGEGKFALLNALVREGFTDKVTFEQIPDKCE